MCKVFAIQFLFLEVAGQVGDSQIGLKQGDKT